MFRRGVKRLVPLLPTYPASTPVLFRSWRETVTFQFWMNGTLVLGETANPGTLMLPRYTRPSSGIFNACCGLSGVIAGGLLDSRMAKAGSTCPEVAPTVCVAPKSGFGRRLLPVSDT